jgi:hypothetical protein
VPDPSKNDDLTHAYNPLSIFADLAPQWIFLRVIKEKLSGLGRGKNYWNEQRLNTNI